MSKNDPMTKNMIAQLPWMQPDDIWSSDGPEEAKGFELGGHAFVVYPNGDSAIMTGRTLFSVYCATCDEHIHRGTTSATFRVLNHLGLH